MGTPENTNSVNLTAIQNNFEHLDLTLTCVSYELLNIILNGGAVLCQRHSDVFERANVFWFLLLSLLSHPSRMLAESRQTIWTNTQPLLPSWQFTY